MFKLPQEVSDVIEANLDIASKIAAGFVCEDWSRRFCSALERLDHFHLVFADDGCPPSEPVVNSIQAGPPGCFELTAKVCSCNVHSYQCAGFVRNLLRRFGSCERTPFRHLYVEDDTVGNDANKCFNKQFLDIALNCFGFSRHNADSSTHGPNSSVVLDMMDMALMPSAYLYTTFLRRLSFSQITELSLLGCSGRNINDQFIAALAAHLGCILQKLILTGNLHVTDHGTQQLASHAVLLWDVDFSGCRNLTAITIIEFVKAMAMRIPDYLNVRLTKCDVSGDHLQMLISAEDKTRGLKYWAKQVATATGEGACLLGHSNRPDKAVLVYV